MTTKMDNGAFTLELLPPEIQYRILQFLPNMSTLLSLIQASPRFLEVYTQAREIIVSKVIQSHVTPVVLPLALDALVQRELRQARRSREDVFRFLETFKLGPKVSNSIHLSLETSKQLLRLHQIVERFIEDFVQTRFAIFTKNLDSKNLASLFEPSCGVPYMKPKLRSVTAPSLQAQHTLDLPESERSRLARAFYHFELFGNLFYQPTSPEDDITLREQADLFSSHLEDWELEELLCVRTYFIDKLVVYLDQVERDVLEDYIKEGPPEIFDVYDIRWDNEENWLFFSVDRSLQEIWVEGCLTRGLPVLKGMFDAKLPDERFAALGDTDPPRPRTTFTGVLSALPQIRGPGEEDLREYDARIADIDTIDNHNAAWLWLWKNRRVRPQNYFRPTNHLLEGLRRCGWVIWSRSTLDSLGMLNMR
jgi:hypothetical protein